MTSFRKSVLTAATAILVCCGVVGATGLSPPAGATFSDVSASVAGSAAQNLDIVLAPGTVGPLEIETYTAPATSCTVTLQINGVNTNLESRYIYNGLTGSGSVNGGGSSTFSISTSNTDVTGCTFHLDFATGTQRALKGSCYDFTSHITLEVNGGYIDSTTPISSVRIAGSVGGCLAVGTRGTIRDLKKH